MGGAFLYGWNAALQVWVRLQCNTDGKLIIDPSEIFEDPPTDGQAGKAPTSNWAFDHKADASAHHTRYTDVETRAALGNAFGATGILLKDLGGNYHGLGNITTIRLRATAASTTTIWMFTSVDGNDLNVYAYKAAKGYIATVINLWNGSANEKVATEPVVDSKIATHAALPSVHHTRYTDAEAVAAVGYNGTKYWSCPGIHFDSLTPATDDVTKSNDGYILANAGSIYLKAAVSLPHGATVTSVIVTGNTSAQSKTWELYALKLSDSTKTQMAYNYIGYADNSIDAAVINNSSYAYFLRTSSLAALDEIWGASITYTL